MKKTNLALMLLVSVCHFAFGQIPPVINRAADTTEILRSLAEISKAYVARDPLPFERLYLSNYVNVRGKPAYNWHDQIIAMMRADAIFLRAGKKLEYETISFENEVPQISFYGRTAIVNVARKNYWRYNSQKCLTRTQATEVWVKSEDEWKIAAAHSTTFQCPAKPFHPMHAAVADVPARSKPANSELQAEQEVREVIKTFSSAQASLEEPLDAVMDRFTAPAFVSTNINGEVGHDRSLLTSIPVSIPGRALGMRNQDDALLIYGNAAVYTFRVRNPGPAGGPQQSTIIFAKIADRWTVVAAHTSKYSAD